jgi:hypothetical protein
LIYGTKQLTLSVGNAGDFNGGGTVNAADYVVWRKGLGTTYKQNDFYPWRTNFGLPGGGSGVITIAAIPEPASLMLTLFAMTGWCLRRRSAV